MTTGTHDSIDYARDVLASLWPESDRADLTRRPARRGGAPGLRAWVVFPSPSRPRTLIPTGVPGAAVMLNRQRGERRLLVRTARALLARATRAGALGWLPVPRLSLTASGDSIETVLAGVLGNGPVTIGLLLGTWRANRKPVLHVFDAHGVPLAFVKVGHNDVTAPLVRAEADNLRALGPHPAPHLQLPELLGHRQWRGMEVLVMSALRHPASSPDPGAGIPVGAMAELARSGGSVTTGARDSGHLDRLLERSLGLAESATRERVVALLRRVDALHGDTPLEHGAWHGDWAPWNMARLDGGVVQLWDWERFERDVPVGFDALHYAIQPVARGTDLDAGRQFCASAPTLLARMNVDARQADATTTLYLAEIAVRYALAAEPDVGAPLRALSRWVQDLLEERTAGPAARAAAEDAS